MKTIGIMAILACIIVVGISGAEYIVKGCTDVFQTCTVPK